MRTTDPDATCVLRILSPALRDGSLLEAGGSERQHAVARGAHRQADRYRIGSRRIRSTCVRGRTTTCVTPADAFRSAASAATSRACTSRSMARSRRSASSSFRSVVSRHSPEPPAEYAPISLARLEEPHARHAITRTSHCGAIPIGAFHVRRRTKTLQVKALRSERPFSRIRVARLHIGDERLRKDDVRMAFGIPDHNCRSCVTQALVECG